ncbi:MAG TPA: discoidin domain-containing protein [Planctomycetota bacterium]|nr:discoidin domain-containing protein [Planctomycetota bacterium]
MLKGWEWWLAIPLAAGLGYLICRLYRRETEPYSLAGQRLRMLRTTTVVLLILLLSQPVIHRVLASIQPPRVIVLRDSSTSMSVKDTHDPLERRVRMAIALGLLDGSHRDTSAEQAAAALTSVQASIESAAASTRQAQQLLQEGAANLSSARERIGEAREALNAAAREASKAAKALKTPELKPQAEALNASLEAVRKELADIALDGADAVARLSERAKVLATAAQESGKLGAACRLQQDKVDRAFGQGASTNLLRQGATASGSPTAGALIDGNATNYDGGQGFGWYDFKAEPQGGLTITLAAPQKISRIRFLLWDREADRTYSYILEGSADGQAFTTLADRSKQPLQSWQEIDIQPAALKAIRLRGTANNKNTGFHVVEVEAYAPDSKVIEALEKLASMDRAAVLKAMMEGKAAEAASGKVDLVQYGFDTDLRDLVLTSEAAKDLPPTDTDLAAPLVKIGERHAQDSVSAVVICSDGRHTSGAIPEDAARVLAARGITVHTVGIGSMDAPPDLCVARLEGTLSVFMEETIRLNAQIRTAGFKGQKCALTLSRGEQVLQTRELTIGDDGWRTESFDIPADKPGANIFTAAIKPLPGEALTNNNSAEAVVEVANDRLKVLLVDEYPRWESRYVASLLRRERKMTLDERWLLSGENLGARPKALPEGEKALEDYEIIVLGDVPAERLSEADQKRLAAYVADRGGFLVLIAGPENLPTKYGGGPIADLLPIKTSIPGGGAPLTAAEAGKKSRVKLDPAGGRHEIVRILRDPGLNEKLWPALPELSWVARPAYAKPGATTLIVTDDARKDVVVATQYYGAGRVLYIGTDGTWNWRYKVADRVHAFFWSQAMRWGTSNRLSGGPRLKAGTGRRQLRPGENIEVLARPRDSEGKSVSDAVIFAELLGAERPQRVQLQLVPETGGLYRGFMQNIPAGVNTIRVAVTSPGFEGIQHDVQVVARENAGQEGVELARDAARLAAVAKAGGGRYVDILEAPELFGQLAGQGRERIQESSYQAWSSYPALLLVVGLLAAEWLLRKRMGLA